MRDVRSTLRQSMDRMPGGPDSIHQLVDSQPWECDKVTIPLRSHGELADGG